MNYRNRILSLLATLSLLAGGGLFVGVTTAASTPPLRPAHSTVVTAKAQSTLLTFAVSSTTVRKHEQIWIAGSAKVGGKPSAGRTVAIERPLPGSG